MRDILGDLSEKEQEYLTNKLKCGFSFELLAAWDNTIILGEGEMTRVLLELGRNRFLCVGGNPIHSCNTLSLEYGFNLSLQDNSYIPLTQYFRGGLGNETDEEWELFKMEFGEGVDALRPRNVLKLLRDNYKQKVLDKVM